MRDNVWQIEEKIETAYTFTHHQHRVLIPSQEKKENENLKDMTEIELKKG